MISVAGCRAGCHFVAGFVAGESASLLPGNADIYRLCCCFLWALATKATGNPKKIEKVKISSQTLAYGFYGVRCRISLPLPLSGSIHLWR